MRISRFHLVTLVLGGLGIGLASAAPTPRAPRAPISPSQLCKEGPPSKARCLSFDTLPAVRSADPMKRRPERKRAYLEGPCGKKYADVCRPHVKGEYDKQHANLNAPKVKMLSPNGTDIPADVNPHGKQIDYTGPKKTTLLGTFPKVGVTRVPSPRADASTLKSRNLAVAPRSTTNTRRVAAMGSTRTTYNLGTKLKLGTQHQTSDNILARTGLTRPPHSGTTSLPTNAHRNPAWDANGEKVGSCEEFAYESVYDWARFTDAVAACAGDHDCQLDIAFLPDTPGIANRTLRRKDGTPLAFQITPVAGGAKLPKNDLFTHGHKFVYAGGPKGVPKSADLDALVDVMKDGAAYYELGCSGPCRKGEFPNEWAFHQTLHDRHRGVSKAEFEEFERRKARFRELISMHAAAVKAEQDAIRKSIPQLSHKFVNPIDMVTVDPFERLGLMQKHARDALNVGRMQQKRLGPAQLNQMPGAGLRNTPVSRVQGTLDLDVDDFHDGSVPPAGVLAAPVPRPAPRAPARGTTPTQPGARGPQPGRAPTRGPARALPGRGPAVKPVDPCNPKNFGKVFESIGRGPISCQIGEFLREEWARKKAGQVSCLDPDESVCDWSPMMFEARFVEGLPYIDVQNEREVYCLDWTNDNLGGTQPNLGVAETYIHEKMLAIKEALEKLAPYKKQQTNSGTGLGFGKGFTDADHFGDKALFAAGYDYDLGWDVEPREVEGSSVCDLSGGARGGFGVHGWFINNKFTVIHALASADVNRRGDKKLDLIAQLHLFEGAVKFLNEKKTFAGSFEKPLLRKAIDIPMGYKPSFTTMAGPVPITGAVWGEFELGADLRIEPVAQAGPDCDMNQLKFGVDAGFVPLAALNAKAQVGVGISGVLSAGIRGMVNLVTVGVPVSVGISSRIENPNNAPETKLGFNLDVQLALSTLSGYISVYVEMLMLQEEFILFRWNGLGPTEISLLGEPVETELPLFVLAK
jgi:hypothetical protein